MWSPAWVPVLYEQRFYQGWWDLQLCSALHSTFLTKVLHTDHRVGFSSQWALHLQWPFLLSALQRDFFFHLLLFFSQIATEILMFACTLAGWEISWCIVRHANHILPSSINYHFHTTFHASLPFKLHCQVYSSLCPKYLHFMKVSFFCPTPFPCLLSSCAMRQHDVNLLSPRYCVASLQIKWWWSSLGLGNRKKWRIPCLHKTRRTVGAELRLEPRISHETACHNKKREIAAASFSEKIC